MVNVLLDGLASEIEEAIVQAWFFEEGEAVEEGADVCSLTTDDGEVVIQAPASGLMVEVYFDEGETVSKGEVLCKIDDENKNNDFEEQD